MNHGSTRFDRRRIVVLGLLGASCALLGVGLTNAGWCMPALHASLTLATALGTWWLARDDLALNGSGAIVRLVVTGLAIGLGLTWLGAAAGGLVDASSGAYWTHGEFAAVFDRFVEDAAWHWTPLGLVAAFVGTGLTIILDGLSGAPPGRDGSA